MTALAQRLVACKHFRWMPGMLDTEGDRWGGVTLHDGAREVLRAVTAPAQYAYEWRDRLPDLDDPATLGRLLALVREAWEDPLICTANGYPTLRWWVKGRDVPGTLYNTEAEALGAALEAAP